MPMYQLTPTFPGDFEVTPKTTCYTVASYHNPSAVCQRRGQELQETDPRKVLEQKQKDLIARLNAQTEAINKLLISLGKNVSDDKKSAPASKKDSPTPVAAPAAAEKDGKKDKDAKKEARKAAKAEAVKKVASGAAPAPKGKSASAVEEGKPWSVEDDRKTWEHGLSLTVNIPVSLVSYTQEHLGQITLTATPADKQWVALLAKVGEKRHVAFNGEVSNKTKDAKTTVTVTKGAKTSLKFEKTSVDSLQTAWKLLGLALGLFSRQPQQVLNASHQALWLDEAASILLGNGDLSFSTRQASQFLARFDSLSSQWDVCLADVVFRSLLNLAEPQPNNVEVWAKKVDKLLA